MQSLKRKDLLTRATTRMNYETLNLVKEPDINGRILHDSISVKYSEQVIYRNRKQISICQGLVIWGVNA